MIEKELIFFLNAKIIVPLRYLKWVSNLVHVKKKNGEISLCVDFRNFNRVSLKDKHPLHKMDYLVQRVIRSHLISMLGGVSGYN